MYIVLCDWHFVFQTANVRLTIFIVFDFRALHLKLILACWLVLLGRQCTAVVGLEPIVLHISEGMYMTIDL